METVTEYSRECELRPLLSGNPSSATSLYPMRAGQRARSDAVRGRGPCVVTVVDGVVVVTVVDVVVETSMLC